MLKQGRGLPSLDLLKGFEAAARNLSFTKAAAELFVTQSAVSRQVKTLEEQLGVALFRRHHRDLRLTEEGQTLYKTSSAKASIWRSATARPRPLARTPCACSESWSFPYVHARCSPAGRWRRPRTFPDMYCCITTIPSGVTRGSAGTCGSS